MESLEAVNVVLSNGKWLQEGKGVDVFSVSSLRLVKRFLNVSIIDKFNVMEHCFMCASMVPMYCDYMFENFPNEENRKTFNNVEFRYLLIQSVLTHDMEEIIIGDLPAPVNLPKLNLIKKIIRKYFRNFLSMDIPDSDAIEGATKHIDILAAFVELCIYYKSNNSFLHDYFELYKYYALKIEKYNLHMLLKNMSEDFYQIYYGVIVQIHNQELSSDLNKEVYGKTSKSKSEKVKNTE